MKDCPACGSGRLQTTLYTANGVEQIKMCCRSCGADLYDDACGAFNRVRFLAHTADQVVSRLPETPSGLRKDILVNRVASQRPI